MFEEMWNHECFANEQEAKACIQLISETYTDFNYLVQESLKNKTEKNTKNTTGENKILAWSWILCNPHITYENYEEEDSRPIEELGESSVSRYGSALTYVFKKLLNSWSLLVDEIDVVTVELDRDYLHLIQANNKKAIINKKGFAVIAAARRLQMISIIYPFYNSQEWQNYIEETNGKLSVIGFQQDNYPRTEEFYIEPDFLNSEGEEVKASIGQPKARILITGVSGMGKTSYLKHLAMLCYRQKICQDYIPVYISLRRAAFLEHQLPQALSQKPIDIYMSVLNNNWGVKLTQEQLINVLVNGKALILIDGLDVNHVNSFYHFNQIK
ncbi:hypothetical protein GNE10_32275, partial [Nostoc sp. 2RC]|nr:hypothetical protein [Nostoc sp. 2RC]